MVESQPSKLVAFFFFKKLDYQFCASVCVSGYGLAVYGCTRLTRVDFESLQSTRPAVPHRQSSTPAARSFRRERRVLNLDLVGLRCESFLQLRA